MVASGGGGWQAANPKCLTECYITARVPKDCKKKIPDTFDILWEYPGLSPISSEGLTWYDEVEFCLWNDVCGTILVYPGDF